MVPEERKPTNPDPILLVITAAPEVPAIAAPTVLQAVVENAATVDAGPTQGVLDMAGEAFVSQTAPTSGDSDFDKVLAVINANVRAYIDRDNGPPEAPVDKGTGSSGPDWVTLGLIALAIYLLIHEG